MNSLIYLGEVPSQGTSVSESLAARNINYVRIEPSKLVPVVHHEFSSTTYSIYRDNLPSFITAAITEKPVPLIDPYHQLEYTGMASTAWKRIPVILNFANRIRDEARDALRREYGLEDTLAKGKPALMGSLDFSQVREIVAEYAPLQTTPSTNTHINLSALKIYRLLCRIAYSFLKTHQYPTRVNDENLGQWDRRVEASALETLEHMEVDAEHPAWTQRFISLNAKYVAHSNLSAPFSIYDPEIDSTDDIPGDAQGFAVPFVEELSLPDYRIVPHVVSTYFLGLLGDTSEDADEAFEDLKGGWGILCRTAMGHELAHLYWCIAFAIQSQSQLLVVKSSEDAYAGCYIIGGGFQVNIRNRLLEPCSREDLVTAFDLMAPHSSTLRAVFGKIAFSSVTERHNEMNQCNSIHALREVLGRRPVAEEKREEIKGLAHRLRFPGNEPLAPTTFNVSRIFGAIANPDVPESDFPMYPSCVVEMDRTKRLLSAFGASAPSFLVPGGKAMMLSSNMEVKERTKKGEQTKQVNKIGYILKPLDQAYQDLISVSKTKSINNPHGSNMMGRSSTASLIRSAEKDIAADILVSLRKYCSVTVADAVGGKRKRGDDDGETGAGGRKKRVMDEF